MSNDGALAVTKLADKVHHIFSQMVKTVVPLVLGTCGVPVPTHVDGDHTVVPPKLP